MASATKRTIFPENNGSDSSPKKKAKKDGRTADKLVAVKKEKKAQNGADAVEVGVIIRAQYGTTNAETLVGEQVCVAN